MFNFIVTDSLDGTTTARILSGDVTSVFCFMNTNRGLNTCGGVLVAGEAVRTNFTQHYGGDVKRHPYDTDDCRVHP